MSGKPTSAPWDYTISDGIHDQKYRRLAALSYAGKAISQTIDYQEQQANAELIVAACNACQEINPEDPIGAAKALRRIVSALDVLVSTIQGSPDPRTLAGRLNTGVIDMAIAALHEVRGDLQLVTGPDPRD